MRLAFDKTAQFLGAAGVPQFAQGLRLDLPYAFPGDGEILAHFFQCVFGIQPDAEAFAEDFFLAARQRAQNLHGLLFEVLLDHRIDR